MPSPPPLMVTCITLTFLLLTLLSRYPLSLPSPPPRIPRFPCLPDPVLFHLAAGSDGVGPKSPKLAFLFLTTTPLPFAPLWDRFFSNASHLFNIYVHADPTRPYSPPFSGVFAGKVIPSGATRRSHPSLVAAARRLLAHALLHDPANSMFALLSPSCVPLRPFSAVYRHLSGGGGAAPAKSYIEILSSEPSMPVRYAARGPGSMLPDVPYERFRVGSQFFILNRKHARLVVNDTVLWDHFRRPCDSPDTCYPEEHYFSTMLSMADPGGCVPATLTNVDWTGMADGHPRTYEPHEVEPELMRGLRSARPRYGEWADGNRSDPFLFARKFSPGCLEPLMNLADAVLFKD